MSLSAFIIRPFGIKPVPISNGTPSQANGKPAPVNVKNVDFDQVEEELIRPALARLNIEPFTTEAVIQAGNIREDMFHFLMTADLVIADITYYNPNVFYELGIRHAFHDRYTFLIRSEGQEDPFDLKTDRYFVYDQAHPGDSVYKLACALRATIASERTDSPVYRLLPKMRAEDRSRFISVPPDFLEAVERACKQRRCGDLQLLGAECAGFLWEIEGLRAVGRAQFDLNFMFGALTSWERIVNRYPNDVEANIVLSTIYHRVSNATRSEQALTRIAKLHIADVNTASQIRALVGRNYKAAWCNSWRPPMLRLKESKPESAAGFVEELNDIRDRALRSPFLRKARQEYLQAYHGNLNYIYAGLNALGLMITEWSLAQEFPESWESLADSKQQAAVMLEDLKEDIYKLTTALNFTIGVEKKRLSAENRVDFWFEIEEAAFLCISSDSTEKVRQNYMEAISWTPESAERSMRPALVHYRELNVRHPDPRINISKNVEGALQLIREAEARHCPNEIVLFVGLRMQPRNQTDHRRRRPAKQGVTCYLRPEQVPRAEQEIAAVMEREFAGEDARVLGMAAGANGSDLLFQEYCMDHDIDTQLFLALPRDTYVGQYVAAGGAAWIDRFNRVYRARVGAAKESIGCGGTNGYESHSGVHVLGDSVAIPRWLQSRSGYTVGKRNSLWMLQHALVQRSLYGPDKTNVTLIALWDCQDTDSMGDIGDLVRNAEENGVKVITIDCASWTDSSGVSEPAPAEGSPHDGPSNGEVSGRVNGLLSGLIDGPVADPDAAPDSVARAAKRKRINLGKSKSRVKSR